MTFQQAERRILVSHVPHLLLASSGDCVLEDFDSIDVALKFAEDAIKLLPRMDIPIYVYDRVYGETEWVYYWANFRSEPSKYCWNRLSEERGKLLS